ncbi:ester cyclase [Parasphingorhabdus sp.]|uniref:ester cyclase n=1 Tax=Parasphingorhabdus sp. TaxID=2709688 RepID=UPI0032672635
MTTREINQQCLLRHMKAEAEHDMAGTLATIHLDALFEDQPIGLILNGREETARHYDLWWSAFGIQTDGGALHWVRDDFVIGDAYFIGKHIGPFLGIEPTGRAVRFPFTVYVRFKDGLLSGERFFYDLNMIMAQLGQPSVPLAA